MAVGLAHAPARLAAIKHRLAQRIQTSPLFDSARFTRHIESAYERMMERWWAGLSPEDFDVSP